MIPLSRFQQELLQFFQFVVEEEGRAPHLHEIALRFGLGEDSARIHISALKKNGFLLPQSEDFSLFRILSPWTNAPCLTDVPIFGSIPAGIANNFPQDDKVFLPIPLERLGIPHSEQIFALEVRGNSMTGKHIVEGDIVVMDKSKRPKHGDVVAALVDGQTTLKTLVDQDGKRFLHAENPDYQDIYPTEELQVQGVMVYLLRKTS